MRIFIISLFTICLTQAGTKASADLFLEGEKEEQVTYPECSKAIKNGVVVTIRENGGHIFFYKDALYTIMANPLKLRCIKTNFNK